jgi:hypothetical protein
MNYKIFLPLIFSILLFSCASAVIVYSDYTDGSQSATINVGDSISFNVDFFSMNPPITSMKAGIYSGESLYYSFLNSNTNEKTYYNTYTYLATLAGTYKIKVIGTDNTNTDSETLTLTVKDIPCPPIDTTPPVITLLGPNPQTITEGNLYHEYGATAWDNVDGRSSGTA